MLMVLAGDMSGKVSGSSFNIKIKYSQRPGCRGWETRNPAQLDLRPQTSLPFQTHRSSNESAHQPYSNVKG